MIIRLAKYSGYCFGVKRAITMALDAANLQENVYSLGPLIHNPQIVESLTEHGVQVARDASEPKDCTVVIRSHGISKNELDTLQSGRNDIVDATCPYVAKAQEIMSKLASDGYPVIILGDALHPEVKGIRSYGNEDTIVVSADCEVPNKRWTKLGLISQTTQKLENLQSLASKLIPLCNELKVHNTICSATSQRQSSTQELAACSDMMVVVGGKNSSNTKMLALLCKEVCDTIHVETAAELVPELFSTKQKIGISAGASTPDAAIIEVYNKIKEINGEDSFVQNIKDIPVFKEESC